jgi:ABC-type uncharacterized transport system ATPase subunit
MGIPEGQCFGFLGINGAGKTTTLKMLTGDILPNSGTATLNGLDILTQQNDVRRLLGYCPQFDALIGEHAPSAPCTPYHFILSVHLMSALSAFSLDCLTQTH